MRLMLVIGQYTRTMCHACEIGQCALFNCVRTFVVYFAELAVDFFNENMQPIINLHFAFLTELIGK